MSGMLLAMAGAFSELWQSICSIQSMHFKMSSINVWHSFATIGQSLAFLCKHVMVAMEMHQAFSHIKHIYNMGLLSVSQPVCLRYTSALCLALQPSPRFPSSSQLLWPPIQAVNITSSSAFSSYLLCSFSDLWLDMMCPQRLLPFSCLASVQVQLLTCAFGVSLLRLALRLVVGTTAAWCFYWMSFAVRCICAALMFGL